MSSVSVNFSAFGGGVVAATNSSQTWSASYTITGGSVDGTNLNVSLTATDNAGNQTSLTDDANVTADNQNPAVTTNRISVSGATGTGGAYKTGDIITASWDNTATGDNNPDIASVSVNFSAFGGGVVAATNSSQTWSASYTITAGSIDGTNLNVSLTATDNAGNQTSLTDDANVTADNQNPAVTANRISVSGATGTGGAYKTGNVITASWDNTATGDNNPDIASVSINFSAFGGAL